ncbi:acyl-CoA dehydrogenase family protein [Brevibacillus dissolubilis]|uniref:acyl-CoA dehydrogenase family protein n=1 Tax=Brevibacillus dissolubilis TaxID=1844116 RepID=UPI001116E7BB|nr:acyl-CoA dehydrogenase family protein [Brevibacillus dissolubilis]
MKTELTDEQLAHKEAFRRFVDEEVVPYAREHDLEERLNPAVIDKVIEKGYLGSMIPTKFGGTGMDMVTLGILNEEIGRGCASLRCLLTVHGMLALAILRWGTQQQRTDYLPRLAKGEILGAFALSEPNVGSDAKSVETTAVLDGDEYVLTGTKKWITMGQIADLFLIIAKCEGQPTAFLVERERPGFCTKAMKGLLGTRATMIAELHMDNCRIPKENIIGRVGTGLTHVGLSCLDYGRYTVAWGCVGTAQAAFEASVAYARDRQQFGAPLSDNQLIRKMISEMTVNIKAARQLCYHAGYLKEVGDPDTIMETWVAKYYASTMVTKVTSDAVQIFGGNGCLDQYPVERYFRDAKINEIIEGSTQMHEILIASHIFKTM